MKKEKVFTIFICVAIGAALAMLLVMLVEMHKPTTVVKDCNDGWSTQTEGDKVYRTYIPADDTCKK